MTHLWTLAAMLAAATPQEDAEATPKKQDELAERVTRLEQNEEKQKSMFKFEDGLKFQSEDGNFTAHVGGRLLTHLRLYFDRPDGARTSPDTFFIREARLQIEGTFLQQFEFKVQGDFPTGATPTLQDGYVGWNKMPELGVRIGQFKEPFSQEEICSIRFHEFVERSVVNRLAPRRDIGIMAHGKLFDGVLGYELGVFNGQGRSVADANDEKDFAIRVQVNPFAKAEIPALQHLRIGVAVTVGDVDSAGSTPLDFTTTELANQFLDATAGDVDGTRTRFGVELSYRYGPFGLRAEWVRRSDEVDIGLEEDENIDMDGWYVSISCLLTGEDKPLETRVKPDSPFDLDEGNWGAFELALRIASLEIDDDVFDLGIATKTGNSNEVLAVTFGVNWYVTRNFRITTNFVYEKFDDDVVFSTGRDEDSAFGMLWRFQIDF